MALALREAGLPDAPCLVFLHGLWMSSSMWQPQIERLCQNYHCVASDLPEHGKSTDIGLLTRSNTSRVVATRSPYTDPDDGGTERGFYGQASRS